MKKVDAVINIGKKVGRGLKAAGAIGACATIVYTGAAVGVYGAVKVLEKVMFPLFTDDGDWLDIGNKK